MLNKVLIYEDYEDKDIRPMVNPEEIGQYVDMNGDYDYPVFEITGICMSRLDAINDLIIDPEHCETADILQEFLRKVHPYVKVKNSQDYEKVRHAVMFDTYSRQAFDLIDADWIYGYEYTDSGEKKIFRADNMENIVISTDIVSLSTLEPSDLKIHKVYELDNIPVTNHYIIVEYDDKGSYETARLMTSDGDLIAWLIDYFRPNEDKARRVFSLVRDINEKEAQDDGN